MKFHFLHVIYSALILISLIGCGGSSGSSETTTPAVEEPNMVNPEVEETTVETTPIVEGNETVEGDKNETVEEIEETTTVTVVSGGGTTTSSTPASGVAPANKGPFKMGSTVTAYKLNVNGTRSAETLSVLTTDDKGTFSITIPWTGATEFNVVGEYLNEVTGMYMSGGDLSAIVDMVPGTSNSIGINVFTHMAAEVMKKKMHDANGAVSIATLKDEATDVIAEQFNLKLDGAELEDLDVTSKDEAANAQLLQVSAAIMSTDDPDATLNNIANDISEDDEIDEEGQSAMDDLQEEMENIDLDEIESVIEDNIEGAVAPVEINALNGTLSWDSNMSFEAINDAFLDTNYTSLSVVVNGVIGTSADVTIVNGSFKVNGTTATTVSNGDQIEVTLKSSSSYSTEVTALLTVGGKELPFVVATKSDPFVADTTPDDFNFGFKKNIGAGAVVISEPTTITGINMPTDVSINGGTFDINASGSFVSSANITNGSTIRVKVTAGALGETKKATVTIGGVEGKFTVSTEPEDKMPIITGSLGSVSDVERNASVNSATITVSDINVDLDVTVVGDGVTVSTATASADTTTSITVTVTAPSTYATEKTVDLHIGSVVIPFVVKTKPDPFVPDTSPNAFSFKKVKTRTAGIEIESEEITVSGINTPVSISVTGATFDINGTASTATTVMSGDRVKLKVTSPAYGSISEARVSIGDKDATFNVETQKDETIESIAFTSQLGVVKNTVISSNEVTVTGINVPVAISISGGEYQIDGGGYTSTAGTIENNQSIQVQLNSSSSAATSAIAYLTVAGERVAFVVTTADDAPVIADAGTLLATEDQLFRFLPTLSEGESNEWEIVGTLPSWLEFNPINGEIRGTPTNNESDIGSYRVEIKAINDEGTNSKTFTINITDVNYLPVLSALANITKVEDSPAFTVELNATDADGTVAIFSANSLDESKATVSVSGSTLTVTPEANATGVVTIEVTATDVKGATDSKSFTLTLTPINDAPIMASIDMIIVDEDSAPTVITLHANDTDGDALSYSAISLDPTKATVSVVGDRLTITPQPNRHGDVIIKVKANDGTVDSNEEAFSFEMISINDLPVAVDVVDITVEDTAKAITLNASDIDEDSLTYLVVTEPQHGGVTIAGNIATYTPDADFTGVDNFTYKVNDGEGNSNIATVTVTVSSENDAPILDDIDDISINEDNGSFRVDLNVTDADTGESFTYEVNSSDVTKATVVADSDHNQLVITPLANQNGELTITVKANDGDLDSNTVTFTVTILPINDAPILSPIPAQSVAEDSGVTTIELNATDIDDGDHIRFDVNSSDESLATVSVSGTSLSITPQANANGVVTISVKASDDANLSDVKIFIFTIVASNDAPVLQPLAPQSINEDLEEIIFDLNATDLDGDSISFEANSSDESIATVRISNAKLIITPQANQYGVVNITFTATDGTSRVSEVFVLTINPVDDAPILSPIGALALFEGESRTLELNASDIDSDTIVYTVFSADESIATVSVSGRILTINAGDEAEGTVDINVTATADGLSSMQTFSLTVIAMNDAPVAHDDNVTVNEDEGIIISVLSNDTDSDLNDTMSIVSNRPALHGRAILLGGNLEIEYIPDPDFNGLDSFEYTMMDELGEESNATVYIVVNPVNDNPILAPVPTQWKTEENQTEMIIELNATDIDGDVITYGASSRDESIITVSLDNQILTLTLVDLNATEVPIDIRADDGQGGEDNSSFMVIDPFNRELRDVDFDQSIPSGAYDTSEVIDPSILFDLPLYSIRYNDCDGLKLERFMFNATSIDEDRAEFNESTGEITWRDEWGSSLTISNNEMFVDEDDDGVDNVKFKYVNTLDNEMLNPRIGLPLFDESVEAYLFFKIQLTDSVHFEVDDEGSYMESYGHTTNRFYTSLEEFMENQKNGAYFMHNRMGEGGIVFSTDSNLSDGSGTLVEVDEEGTVINADAGSWHIDDAPVESDESDASVWKLYVEPNDSESYRDQAYKVITHDEYGDVLINGEYTKAGDEEAFIWFSPSGKDQFLQFLNDNDVPYLGRGCNEEGEDHNFEPIMVSDLISGTIIFRDADGVETDVPPDARIAIGVSRFMNDESGWNRVICPIDADGNYGDECYIDHDEEGIREAFSDSNESFEMRIFSDEDNNTQWDCNEDVYLEDDNQSLSTLQSIEVTPNTYQDRDDSSCGDEGGDHEPIMVSDILSGVVNFEDNESNPIAVPDDAYIRIVPSRFQNNDSGWNGLICKVEDNGSYGGECYIDYDEDGIREAFADDSETFQVMVFKNHIDPEKHQNNCGEDVYKGVGDDLSLTDFSTITVVPDDYQDHSEDSCDDAAHESIMVSDILSGVVNFEDNESNPIAVPNDAYIRMVPSRFQNDDSGWNGLICKVEDNGSYGGECYIDYDEEGIREALADDSETFQVMVFKNHIDSEDHHHNCGEDIYKWAGDALSLADFSTITVVPDDYQDRSTEACSTEGDEDGDNIPDSIEAMLGLNSSDSDEDGNGILDGLEIDGEHGDQFFDMQWHIRSLGTVVNGSGVSTIAGHDLDLLDIYHRYMGYNEGNPIIVQVVDDGVDADHEDLVDNMDLSRSYSHSSSGDTVGDPSATDIHDTHGTMVAGIIGARAFNGKGVRGIAPFVKIAGSNWMEELNPSGLEKVWYSGDGANEIAVTNNSWGSYFSDYTLPVSILEAGTSSLRDGKGRVYVFAAGNSRGEAGNSNISYLSNNRFVIAVAALKHDNTYASYSSPGGNVLISGYSGDYYQNSPTIGTTTVEGESLNSGDINEQTTWSEDSEQKYTFAMNGTSAASPVVAGSIALVLEACPNLTWRDVKYLVAKHGKRVDGTNPSWVENSAGLWYSSDYGYGLINPKGMIDDCEHGYASLGNVSELNVTETIDHALADGSDMTINGLNIHDNVVIEWVELTVDSNHTQASDYGISLTSPSGTIINVVDWTRTSGDWMNGGFTFGVAGFVDENSSGDWSIGFIDYNINDENLSGAINNVMIKVYGH